VHEGFSIEQILHLVKDNIRIPMGTNVVSTSFVMYGGEIQVVVE
jgi:hypothetical protein